jgi:hypothetical protein
MGSGQPYSASSHLWYTIWDSIVTDNVFQEAYTSCGLALLPGSSTSA